MWDRYVIQRKINSLARRLGSPWAPAMPVFAWIGPTTRCNLKCRTCYLHQFAERFEDMSPEVYERIRRELLPSLRMASLSGAGEPFLADVTYRMIDDAFATDTRLEIITNGTIIRRDCLEHLVRAPSRITVSLDGTTPEVLGYIRPGARFGRVMKFMETVKELRDRTAHPQFEFHISFVVTRSNVEQMTDCVELAHRHGVSTISFANFQTGGRTDEFALRESLVDQPAIARPHWEAAHRRGLELGIQVVPLVFDCSGRCEEEQRRAQSTLYSPAGEIRACPHPWWSTHIESDGSVKPCCVWSLKEPFGNLREQSFRAIWNGPQYRALRRTVNTPAMPDCCKHCALAVRL